MIYEILTRLGFKKFVMNVNNRKIITGIGQFSGVPEDLFSGLYRSIDKLDKIGLEGVREELKINEIPEGVINKLLDLLQIEGENKVVLAALRDQLDYPVALGGIAELEEIIGYLQALGIPEVNCKVKFAMVRGLEYYTGPIYETVVEEPKIGSITGGGRFDNLVGMFMDRSYPATGTTIGIERIIDVMEELNLFPPDVGKTSAQVLMTLFDESLVSESLKMANTLRKGGLKTALYFEKDRLGDQIGYARKKGIPYVVILGPDELAADQVTVRNLFRREQQTVKRVEAVGLIKQWMGETQSVAAPVR